MGTKHITYRVTNSTTGELHGWHCAGCGANWDADVERCPNDQPTTDCRSPEGVTVGLIDSIITSARVLRGRDLSDPAVADALRTAG